MKDLRGAEVQVGDNIILTVSRRSHYLASATIDSLDEKTDTVIVRYTSTITTKTIHGTDPFIKYEPTLSELNGEVGLCRDCVDRIVEPGNQVAYRTSGGIAFGEVSEVKDSLWVQLSNGQLVRNVGIFVL